jgi:hypothetical protein
MSPQHPSASLSAVFRRPFDEQVAFFRGKLGNLVPTERWTDVWKQSHDRAFMVAGAAKAELLADLAAAVDAAIAEGESIESFRGRFGDIVQRHGWQGWTGSDSEAGRAWRTRVIYTTNAATSYAAGRLAQLKQGGFAYWVYRHSDSVLHPRPLHLAWDGLTLPADHEWWRTHYPPNGWGCKCYVMGARNARAARRLGGDPDKPLDPAWGQIDTSTGEPVGIDKGWGYMPGATSDLVREIERKMASLPKQIAAALGADITNLALEESIDWVVRQSKELGDRTEFATLITDRVVWRKRGVRDAVYFSDDEIDQMRGATLVHNHPSSRSLSGNDLFLALKSGLKEIVAAGHDGSRYVASDISDALKRYYDVADRHAFNNIKAMIDSAKISVAEAERWHHHAVNEGLFRAGVIRYQTYRLRDVPSWVSDVAARIADAIAGLERGS